MTGDSPKHFDITNVDEASPQFYGSFVLKLGKSPGNRLPVCPDHGAQTSGAHSYFSNSFSRQLCE